MFIFSRQESGKFPIRQCLQHSCAGSRTIAKVSCFYMLKMYLILFLSMQSRKNKNYERKKKCRFRQHLLRIFKIANADGEVITNAGFIFIVSLNRFSGKSPLYLNNVSFR